MGIWATSYDVCEVIGPNPSFGCRLREERTDEYVRPAGIRNLGATCYANVILQVGALLNHIHNYLSNGLHR